jgi:DNA mismatch repair protein MutS
LCSFTQLAIENKYVCPELDESFELDIKMEDTPLSKKLAVGMPSQMMFFLDREAADHDYRSQYVGKSAILRQTALIVLLAQMGSLFLQIVSGWNCR